VFPALERFGVIVESGVRVHKTDFNGEVPTAARRRNWKNIHHSPAFWFGAFLFLLAIAIYVLSDDLSWRPHFQIR
jgi:uncharacterized iron-regulated membrane protein